MSEVKFTVPDFVDADGIHYSEIEVVVETDGDVRETTALVGSVERSLDGKKEFPEAARPRPGKTS